MTSTSTLGATLLQSGLLIGCLLLAQLVAVRHLPADSIPGVLRTRVALSNSVRPWLLAAAAAMAGAGVLVQMYG